MSLLCGCNSVVEFLPSKQVVAGSNPVARSNLLCFIPYIQSDRQAVCPCLTGFTGSQAKI